MLEVIEDGDMEDWVKVSFPEPVPLNPSRTELGVGGCWNLGNWEFGTSCAVRH